MKRQTTVTGIPESLIMSGNVPHPADHPELFRQTGENEFDYIGPDDFEDDITDEECDLYAEGRALGFEMIKDYLLDEDLPEAVFAGILEEFAQFLVEIGIADEFRETLEYTEQLIEEMEAD